MSRKRDAWIVLAAALVASSVARDATPRPTTDYPTERSVQLLFAAATEGGPHKYPPYLETQNRLLAYAAIGMFLLRLDQLDITLEYGGPKADGMKSLELSLRSKAPRSSHWIAREVSADELVKLLTVLAREGHFIETNHAGNRIPERAHYRIRVRSEDDAVEYYRTADIAPAAHDDARTGAPRPDLVRVIRELRAAAPTATDAFDELLAPLLPLGFSIRVEQARVVRSEPVTVTMEMKNTGTTPLSIATLGGFDDREPFCDVVDEKGAKVEYPRRWLTQRRAAGPADFVVIRPEATRALKIDLTSGLLRPLAPGRYRVTCTYYGETTAYDPATAAALGVTYPWRGTLRSNTATFIVQ